MNDGHTASLAAVGGGEQASILTLAYHLTARGMLAPGENFKEN